MTRQFREEAEDFPHDDWSEWVKAMVPDQGNAGDPSLQGRKDGHDGMMCKAVRNALPDLMKFCGVYEWATRGTVHDQPMHLVVYVGSTCRDKPGALRRRTLEYCRDGSHKEKLINKALRRGYELWFRVKTTEHNKEAAEDAENTLLRKYNYAWNVRKNAIRYVFPEDNEEDDDEEEDDEEDEYDEDEDGQ